MEQGRKWRVAFYRCAHFHGDRIHDEPATLVRDHHREAPGSESIRRILHPFAPDRSLDHLRYLLVQPVGADSPTAYPLSDRPGACARRSALRRFAIGNRPSPIDSDRRFNPGQSPPYQVQPTVIHRSVGSYTRAATGTPQHQQSNRPRQAAGHRCAQKGRRTFSTESRGATPASYARLRLACSLASMRVRVICARTRAGESGHISTIHLLQIPQGSARTPFSQRRKFCPRKMGEMPDRGHCCSAADQCHTGAGSASRSSRSSAHERIS
jgi:hypothetical protein